MEEKQIMDELKMLGLQYKALDITKAFESSVSRENIVDLISRYWNELYDLNLKLLKAEENYKAMVIDLKKQLTRSEARNIK